MDFRRSRIFAYIVEPQKSNSSLNSPTKYSEVPYNQLLGWIVSWWPNQRFKESTVAVRKTETSSLYIWTARLRNTAKNFAKIFDRQWQTELHVHLISYTIIVTHMQTVELSVLYLVIKPKQIYFLYAEQISIYIYFFRKEKKLYCS